MKRLLRPSILLVVLFGLATSAAALALWPRAPVNRAWPLAVPEGDQEVVWLYSATNAVPWERFVFALKLARSERAEHSPASAFAVDDHNAFPDQTTAVPEVAVTFPGSKRRLWFRWYKITSDLKSQDWVAALVARRTPPLAIIGGNTSDVAIDLARSLRTETERLQLGPAEPLLLLTTATADAADNAEGTQETLNNLYPKHVFRFCFTNKQMAEAVISFIWSHGDLRPDSEPYYVTFWKDDPYSTDLNLRFCDALRFAPFHTAARDWAWQAATAALGGVPLDLSNVLYSQSRMEMPFYPASILYSVGAFARPNRWESVEADQLMDRLDRYPQQRRPLLVVPAATQPARRFLRGLVHTSPIEARRFIVATGDAIAFNTVYHDRNMAWPIQDLPFTLVFFCHRNPTDPKAQKAQISAQQSPGASEGAEGAEAPGTEDLLLFVDMVDVLIGTCQDENGFPSLPANAARLRERFSLARWSRAGERVTFDNGAEPLFNEEGNRYSGTGEHVVLLRPSIRGQKVLAEAYLEVCPRVEDARGKWTWLRPAKPLVLHYEGYSDPGGAD